MANNKIPADADVGWYADGPTTHLTEDGEMSLCGLSSVPEHVDTYDIEPGSDLYLCERCVELVD